MDRCQANSIARVVFKELQAFYADPENMRKFEEWKKQRNQKENENKAI